MDTEKDEDWVTDSGAAGWAEKYRPKNLTDVIGQRRAVDLLSARIDAREARNLILTGPTGSGKTTLAEIYGRAIMCRSPKPGGVTCGECPACLMFRDGQPFEFHHVGAAQGDKETVTYLLEEKLEYHPQFAERHVVVFDEADTLTFPAREALLTELEDDRATFIFALIEGGALPDRFRDRCDTVELQAPDPTDGLALIDRVASSEGFTFDQSAFELLWRLTPRFRGFLAQVEALLRGGEVPHLGFGLARDYALSSAPGSVLRWLRATIDGDLEPGVSALSSIQLDPPRTADLVLELLGYLKSRFVGPALVQHDRSAWELLLGDADAATLVDGLAQRAAELDLRVVDLVDYALEFWSFLPLRVTKAVLDVHAMRFRDLLWLESNSKQGASAGAKGAHVPSFETYASSSAKRSPPRFRSGKRTTEDCWIDARQARMIYEAATFLPQAHGTCFNAELVLRAGSIAEVGEAGAKELSSELLREMQQRMAAKSLPDMGGELHRIALHERLSGGFETTVVLHVPSPAASDDLEEWLTGFFRRRGASIPAEHFQWSFEDARTWKGASRRHWMLVRNLWRGVDPSLTASGDRLVDLLKVPVRERRPAGELRHRRLGFSASFGVESRKEYSAKIAPPFSAWKEGAWEHLFDGWEAQVFETRTAAWAKHERELLSVESEQGEAPDSLTKASLGARGRKLADGWAQRQDLRRFPW